MFFSQSEHSEVTSTEFEKKNSTRISEVPLSPFNSLLTNVNYYFDLSHFSPQYYISGKVKHTFVSDFFRSTVGVRDPSTLLQVVIAYELFPVRDILSISSK